MKQSTIFQTQTIDFSTGEIKEMTVVKASGNKEKFFMGRESDGLDWFYNLSGNQLKTLVFLLSLERVPKESDTTLTHVTVLGKTDREVLQSILKCTPQYLNRVISSLIKEKWLVKLSTTDFIINPKGFYKGPAKDVFKRMTEFNRLVD